ncbi:hypothetical protein EDD29_0233 [Actinocorallia herbida]|uniref:Parallel beta helix pectate lyase-like protein n=1 Tax=Actinocorallia herbida TaxID=58109 RepID=A0A3N1CN54_9ACTN|nr:hypothetical protein [Actinocorallia herbida]ROO82750.1 hypothetical protein EDD29_0233 [Actinocorallia herbida]
MIRRSAAAAMLALTLAACRTGTAEPTPVPPPTASPSTAPPSATPPGTPPPSTGSPSTPRPTPTAPGRGCPASAHPTPACTGVPPKTKVRRTVQGDYEARTPGEVIDGWHITGQLITYADGVTVRDTRIDGGVSKNDKDGARLTLVDSTIGSPDACLVSPAIDTGYDTGNYTATRVLLQGHDDGFRTGGPDITIADSFVRTCGTNPESHGDGLQDYPGAQRLVVRRTTFDMCNGWATDRSRPACDSGAYPGMNGGVFIFSRPSRPGEKGSTDVTLIDNLVVGGLYGIWVAPAGGTWVLRGNKVVDRTWVYGPFTVEETGSCARIGTWQDNTVVTMDTDYRVTGTVRTVPCG